jgi:hypothetical protein
LVRPWDFGFHMETSLTTARSNEGTE